MIVGVCGMLELFNSWILLRVICCGKWVVGYLRVREYSLIKIGLRWKIFNEFKF